MPMKQRALVTLLSIPWHHGMDGAIVQVYVHNCSSYCTITNLKNSKCYHRQFSYKNVTVPYVLPKCGSNSIWNYTDCITYIMYYMLFFWDCIVTEWHGMRYLVKINNDNLFGLCIINLCLVNIFICYTLKYFLFKLVKRIWYLVCTRLYTND